MRTLKSRYRIRRSSADKLMLSTSPARTVGFSLLFVLFLLSFVYSIGQDSSGRDPALIGTLLHGVVVVAAFIVAAFPKAILFDAALGRATVRIGIFNVVYPIVIRTYDHSQIVEVVMREIRVSPAPNGDEAAGRDRRYPARGSARVFKLILRTETGEYCIEQGTFREELSAPGKGIAEFLDIPFRVQQV